MIGILAALVLGSTLQGLPGSTVSSFEINRSDGQLIQWSPGKTTAITFIAFWCDTWREHLARIEKAKRALGGSATEFIEVAADGSRQGLIPKNLNIGIDGEGRLAKALGLDRIPATLVVDPKGRITWRRDGIIRTEDLIAAIRSLSSALPEHVAYLTFDDFPGRARNEELLDILREHQIEATFFLIGGHLLDQKELLLRAVREGHSLQVHGWHHEPSLEGYRRTIEEIRAASAQTAHLVRPPGSERIFEYAQGRLQPIAPLPPIVDPYDYSLPGEKELVRRVLAGIKPGCVIQLHAGVPETLQALPSILSSLKSLGYEFKKLE
jgi:peptidoglycan/xylan/chitin deacetylase (PgdA/CDA1 family)